MSSLTWTIISNNIEIGLTEVKALLIYEDEQGAEDMLLAIQDIIEKNSLTDFDKANLLPTKLKKGLDL